MTILFLFISFSLIGQEVVFSEVPLNKQLVARDTITNLGQVVFSGEVKKTGVNNYDSLRITVYKNNNTTPSDSTSYALTFNGSKAPFSFSVPIHAELSNYSFKVYLVEGNARTLISLPAGTGNDVVAGDVYVIQGQSNAVANVRDGLASEAQNDFIRVYASGTQSYSTLQSQDVWSIANVNGGSEALGNTGQWGAKIASLIIAKYGIPIAIFNGARGGKIINYFLEDNTGYNEPTPSTNNYFRLKYRLNKSGLSDSVRAIFWSQGENVSTSISNYKTAFLDLRTSWIGDPDITSDGDFPSVKQIYIFQIINGCNAYSNGNFELLQFSKEAQRQLAEENNEIQIMNTDGLVQHTDFCHFVYNDGYQGFGERIFPLVDSYFYKGTSVETEYLSPNIEDAFLIDDVTLVVETDAEKLNMDNSAEAIKNFVLDGNGTILDAYTFENQIIFTLSAYPGINAKISNVGAIPGVHDYLINNASNDIIGPEILSFYEYPIRSDLITIWNNNTWSNGTPNDSKNTIIDDNFNGINIDLITNDLKINAGNTLNYNTNSNNSVIVNGDMRVNGNFIVGDIESLIIKGVNADVEINGSYRKIEKSTELQNNFDVTYWSSSVENANTNNVFITKGVNSNRIFYYDPFTENPNYTGNYFIYRHWHNALGSYTMTPGQGFSVDGEEGATYPAQIEVEFIGKPNYKDISIPIGTSSNVIDDNDRTNLIGNPYPSAIDADAFIQENSDIKDGTLYLWSHRTSFEGGQYTPADYLTYNLLGGNSSDISYPYYIASGQGFMILTDVSAGTIDFKNSMQVANSNDEFYKSSKRKKKNPGNNEIERLWLELLKNNSARKEILIGFSDDGSESIDYGLDGKLINTEANLTFYSLIDNDKYAIQGLGKSGKGRPVKLGFSTLEGGNFKIGISKEQGFAENIPVFLKDRNTHTMHDLSKSDYEFFISEAGDYPDRFRIQFVGGNKTDERDQNKNILKVTNSSNGFNFKSSQDVMELKLYDMFGRIIYHSFPNENSFNIELNKVKKGTIVVIHSKMDNGHIHSLKMIKQ